MNAVETVESAAEGIAPELLIVVGVAMGLGVTLHVLRTGWNFLLDLVEGRRASSGGHSGTYYRGAHDSRRGQG